MSAQAEALQDLVSFFRVAGLEAAPRRKPARVAAQAHVAHAAPHEGNGVPRAAANGAGDFKRF